MTEGNEYETTDIVICGCGPTGALLSAYLSRMSVPHIVLEKETTITTDPRGIALDEDGIRLLQGVGIYDKIYSEIGTCMGQFQFIGGTKKHLNQKPFLQMDYTTTEGGTGHVGFICHKQPVLEKYLRDAMQAPGLHSVLRSGCSVSHLSEDEDWTYCHYLDSEGTTHQIRSRFFVGADGKTGFTRKMYLEPLGIQMNFADHAFYEETWVALNWEITLPTAETHPTFPLWAKGYTPEQFYDAFFPANFRFLCNPERPAVCDGLAYPETGSGALNLCLSQNVQFPEDCIRVLRSRPFRFSARSCCRWAQGRVVLCGDAAHVFPPFGGQGIASGFRDAASLAWRLALLCRQRNAPISGAHVKILRGWYLERKQQFDKSLASTIRNGRFVTESNPLAILLRSCLLFIQNLVPSWRRELRLGRRAGGMVRYAHAEGMPFLPEYNGGLCLPQAYCKPVGGSRAGAGAAGKLHRADEVEDAEGIRFTDDVIFASTTADHTRLFKLLVYLQSTDELLAACRQVADVETMSRGEIYAEDVTFLVERTGDKQHLAQALDADDGQLSIQKVLAATYQIVTGAEFAASPLCRNRPEPRFYDPYYMGKVLGGRKYVVVRPDRFIFAAVDSRQELQRALGAVADCLGGVMG